MSDKAKLNAIYAQLCQQLGNLEFQITLLKQKADSIKDQMRQLNAAMGLVKEDQDDGSGAP